MTVLRLYPPPQQQLALRGLYLNLNLHRQAVDGDVLIYSNYITSLDGRISVRDAESGEYIVPASIANKRDWRLYQELAAQADVLLTSARYFRQLAKGKAQDALPVGTSSGFADLLEWRARQGLKKQPDVMVLSNSLDIPQQAMEMVRDRSVSVITSQQGDEKKIGLLQSCGIKVYEAGKKNVEGLALKRLLIKQGYRSACMVAGPEAHWTLIADHVLDRMFLSTHLSLLGGHEFHTILNGNIENAVHLELRSLYLDQDASTTQLFAQYALSP